MAEVVKDLDYRRKEARWAVHHLHEISEDLKSVILGLNESELNGPMTVEVEELKKMENRTWAIMLDIKHQFLKKEGVELYEKK